MFMSGNTFGQIFRVTTFGESHGAAVGVVIDGCPAGLRLCEADIQPELARRRPGQSEIVTPRDEDDKIEILSGVFEGVTLGTPIMMMVYNKDSRSVDYENIKKQYRPSHADYTYDVKYGRRDYRGGGRSSARTTLAIVAAGAVAKKYLMEKIPGFEVLSYVQQVGEIVADCPNPKIAEIEASIVRCPDPVAAEKMIELIKKLKSEGNTVGGVIKGMIRSVPAGLGEPVFDKLSADLAKGMMAINAVKGFEIGSGFEGVKMHGSEHNDQFYMDGDKVRTKTNYSGGIQGGISDGEEIYFRVAFKPVATIMMKQGSVDNAHHEIEMQAVGRHDPCVVPRAVAIVDAISALTVIDHLLRSRAYHSV